MVILVYVTCADGEEAEKIAVSLVEKKFVACVNYFQCKSVFKWKGKLEKTNEVLLLAKTIPEKVLKVEKEIKQLHSYENPCICFYEALAESPEFAEWVEESVS